VCLLVSTDMLEYYGKAWNCVYCILLMRIQAGHSNALCAYDCGADLWQGEKG
jgi:hypothetical protein